MSYKLEVNFPDYPKGHEFDLGGVLVENGSTKTLNPEDEARIVAFHGQSIKDALGNSACIKISGTKEGGD